jgi:hypothetical protein
VTHCQMCGLPNPTLESAWASKNTPVTSTLTQVQQEFEAQCLEQQLIKEEDMPQPEECKEFPNFPRTEFIDKYYRHNLQQISDPSVSNDVIKLISEYAREGYEVGDRIDAQDIHGKWYPSEIMDLSLLKVKVRYDGWSSKWDEWIDLDSGRIAEVYSHSSAAVEKTAIVVPRQQQNQVETASFARTVDENAVLELITMGFDEGAAVQALRVHRNNLEAAVNSLLQMFS